MSAPPTAPFRVTAWLAEPDERRGFRFAQDTGGWEYVSYPDLASRVARATGAFRAAGVGPGWRVGLIYPTGPDFVTALLGLWGAGATPCPIAPPAGPLRGTAYADHLAALRAAADLRAVAVAGECAAAVSQALAPAAVPVLTDLHGPAAEPDLAAPDGAALIQFSSGSTARPKGIVITAEALSGHTAAIASWLGLTADTPTAGWIPLHHDMGLVGSLLTPMALGADIWLMRPEHFLRRPVNWLRCFGQGGAVASAATSWGLAYVARRVGPPDLAEMDFRGWQALVVGAERVRPDAVRGFQRLLEPRGFRARAVVPGYGMAEAVLAITGDDIGREPRYLRVDADQLVVGCQVPDAAPGDQAVEITSCGMPLAGTSIRILDDAGRDLPAGHLGEIEVTSPTLAVGYAEHGVVPATRFRGVLRTGDAGFVADGELYVIGRVGDSMNVRGQRVFAEDLEQVLHRHLPGLGDPVVLLGARAVQDVAVVLTERADPGQAAEVARLLLPYLPGIAVEIRRTPRRAILRTTSGKPRRHQMWQALQRRALAGQQLYPPVDEITAPGISESTEPMITTPEDIPWTPKK